LALACASRQRPRWRSYSTREDESQVNATWFRTSITAVAVLSMGCATSGDVEKLDRRVKKLELEREQLAADVGKLESLHEMLHEAEEMLRKSGADLGNRLARLEQDFPKFKGDVEAFDFRVNQVIKDLGVIKKELADRLGWTVVYLPSDLPKDKDGIWKAAEERGKADKFQEAKAIFELYEASFPDDPRAPQALVEVGKLLERAGDVEGAIKAYQGVYERHEKSPLAASSTFRIAELFVLRKNCERAKAIYRFVETQFKGTSEAAEARARGRNVMSECKGQ
jgi:TolA-binding protein